MSKPSPQTDELDLDDIFLSILTAYDLKTSIENGLLLLVDSKQALIAWRDRYAADREQAVKETQLDPFDFVEPCEPDCAPDRHAYHQGQWDMATRMKLIE